MRSYAALFLSFAASALAYTITIPNSSQGWTNSGAQTVTWTVVSTDPQNFTIVLTNTDRNVLPINNQILTALVNGSDLTTTVNPPSGGWKTGGTYRVNFVKDPDSTDTIYAQSNEFNITASTGSSSSSTGSATGTKASPSTSPQTATGTTPVVSATSGSTDSSSTDVGGAEPTSNAALSTINTQMGLMGVFALLGVFLA